MSDRNRGGYHGKVRKCLACGRVLAKAVRSDSKYCGATCRVQAFREQRRRAADDSQSEEATLVRRCASCCKRLPARMRNYARFCSKRCATRSYARAAAPGGATDSTHPARREPVPAPLARLALSALPQVPAPADFSEGMALIASQLATLRQVGAFKQQLAPSREQASFFDGVQMIARQALQTREQIRPLWEHLKEKGSLPVILRALLLDDVLPVFDNLYLSGRALRTTPILAKDVTLQELVGLALATMLSMLKSFDMVPIEPMGARFDPRLHEAVQLVERTDVPPRTVVDVLRPGFLMDGVPLRAARVSVSGMPVAEGT